MQQVDQVCIRYIPGQQPAMPRQPAARGSPHICRTPRCPALCKLPVWLCDRTCKVPRLHDVTKLQASIQLSTHRGPKTVARHGTSCALGFARFQACVMSQRDRQPCMHACRRPKTSAPHGTSYGDLQIDHTTSSTPVQPWERGGCILAGMWCGPACKHAAL